MNDYNTLIYMFLIKDRKRTGKEGGKWVGRGEGVGGECKGSDRKGREVN